MEVLALKYGGSSAAPILPNGPVHTTLVTCRGRQKIGCPPGFEAALRNGCGHNGDVLIHDNGLWLPTNHAAARVARALQIPFIISPRGMLTPWAMQFHGFKKRLAWLLYQRRDLRAAQVLHATSYQEAKEFRALGLTQPIAVIPNGVSLPEQRRKVETRTLLFLSRLHPKKGLLDLVAAWAAVSQQSAGWQVVIAGGDENGHLAVVKAEIKKHKLETCFKFIGEVADEKKWDVYRRADLFVLPTKSENFGIVIAEALACGVPVITTKGTPWEELNAHQCGWWVEIGARPLQVALSEALCLSAEERHQMGLRGRKLVEESYAWPAAAKKMTGVYQWMLGGLKPDCVDCV